MWTCATCGRAHEDSLTVCSHCGAAEPHAAEENPPKVAMARPVARVVRSSPPVVAIELPTLTRRDAAIDLTLIMFLTLGMPILGAIVLAVAHGPSETAGTLSLSAADKWIEAAMICGIAAYLCIRHRLPPAAVGVRADRLVGQVGWGLLGLVLCYGWLLMSAVPLALLGTWTIDDVQQREKIFQLLPLDSLGRQLVLFTAVAIHEELWFRGLLLPYLRKLTGRWWIAVVISAGLFGLLHIAQGVLGIVQVAGLGIVLGVLFVRTRSLLTVMIAHFLFDFIQTRLAPLILRAMQNLPIDVH